MTITSKEVAEMLGKRHVDIKGSYMGLQCQTLRR